MNWHFLNAAALWALPAVLIPLVFHFLMRRPAKPAIFGDLRLLKEVIKRERPRKRLREWLILLLRILALACLFFFLARPVVKTGGGASSADSLAVVILLDASYSMRAREAGISNWDRAVLMAEKTLSALGDKDRSGLVVFSDRVEFNSVSLTGRHRDLMEKIREFKPGSRTTQFVPAFQAAFSILERSDAPAKSVMLLSDNAAHGWPRELQDLLLLFKDSKVQIVSSRLPSPQRNLAVSDALATPDFSGNRLRIDATVHNTGEMDLTNVPVALETQADLAAPFVKQSEALVDLKAGEKTLIVLSAPMNSGESLLGRVVAAPDSLDADNFFYFGLHSPEKIRILCVEEPSGAQALTGESFYFREALLAPPSPFEITTVNVSEIKRQNLASYSVMVLVNPGQMEADALRQISAYVERGGSLLVTSGERVSQSGLDDILPVHFGSVLETGQLSVSVRAQADDAPALSLASEYDWDKFNVEKIVEPVLKDAAEPFLAFSDGKPLLVFSGDGRTAVWMTTLDRKWTGAASKPAFVPLMRHVAGRLSLRSSQGPFPSLRVGDPAMPAAPAPKERGLAYGWQEPGIFKAKDFVCVNVEPRGGESSASPLPEREMRALFPENPLTWVETGEKFQQQLLSLLRGKDVARIFLLAAAVFLFFEILLASRRIRTAAALVFLMTVSISSGSVVPGNRFIFAQLKAGPEAADWDPYPSASRDILSFLQQTTSVKTVPSPRWVDLQDPLLFQSPFLVFTGAGRLSWTKTERDNLKKYISGGGLVFVENRTGEISGSFDDSFRSELKQMFPEKALSLIPRTHAVFRSFYLLRTVGGRRQAQNYLEGLEVDGRVAVIYSHNDILGAWAKDLLGNYLFECSPGGEAQRWESQKLMMNIIVYSVTGTYKTDTIHTPFIEDKLRN
ncbi:MAG: hypothetical protein A2901_01310 [Elusimicrobia bacterium RIFCSPLOWO2_01_FULL_54_10]|nr:MAG: hypothetical protein A2901_01310 [Elusimicrobia bacterium RIFCSPLOWO2_01_FULL_54_10]